MTDAPPPGWVPPGAQPGAQPGPQPQPGWYPPPGGYGGYPAPPVFVPAHKPGVVPLRPLNLGDLFDGAFKTIRHNPKPMLGLAALLLTGFMLVPSIGALLLALTGNLSLPTGEDFFDETSGTGLGEGLAYAVSVAGTLFGLLANLVLNGMIVHVVAEAAVGRKSSIADAWAAARPALLRLVGLSLLSAAALTLLVGAPVALAVYVGLTFSTGAGLAVGLPLVPAGIAVAVFVQIRLFQLAAPALVLERLGVLAAIRRSFALSSRQFWRILGITILTALVVGVVGQVAGFPFALAGGIGPALLSDGATAALVMVFSTYLSEIVIGVVTTPFTSAVVALQYIDQRIRKEGYDVELLAVSQQPGQQPGQPVH